MGLELIFFGPIPADLEAIPILSLSDLLTFLLVNPSFNVSYINFASLTVSALSKEVKTLTFLLSVKFFALKILRNETRMLGYSF